MASADGKKSKMKWIVIVLSAVMVLAGGCGISAKIADHSADCEPRFIGVLGAFGALPDERQDRAEERHRLARQFLELDPPRPTRHCVTHANPYRVLPSPRSARWLL